MCNILFQQLLRLDAPSGANAIVAAGAWSRSAAAMAFQH